MRRLVAVAALAAMTACGSTVQVTGATATGGADPGLQGPVASRSAPAVGSGPVEVTGSAPGVSTGANVLPPGTSDQTGPPSSVTSGGTPVEPSTTGARGSGHGYTAKQIRMGFTISSNGASALGSFGLGATIANQKDLINTWVAKVNKAGGVAGRVLVPVFYDYSATGDVNTQDQAACAAFTQDTTVFAATGVRAGVTGSGDTLTPCLAKAGVPWLAGSGDAHKWAQYLPAMFSTSDMDRTREERVLVESLHAQGVFTAKTKIGVIVNDATDNMTRAVKEGMVPALRRLGLTITKQVTVSTAETESNNAELQMFAAGVTHVLFAAPGGAGAAFFMQSAENQRRSYEYGISTQDAPGIALQGLAPASQLAHAHGYGYRPGLDVDDSHQPAATPGMRTCFDYYRSKGFSTASLNRAGMALVCDGVTLLHDTLAAVANPSQAGFGHAVAALGRRLPVASTFQSAFTATQHDGIGVYRTLRYVADCSCFQYSGPDRQIP